MTEPIIKLENITKTYQNGEEKTEALRGINLEINKGEFIAIMGPSGSGKSTLMHILGLLDTPSSGKYTLNGQDVSKLRKNKQAEIRNKDIGFVFQQFNLLPRATVLENVLLPTNYGNISYAKDRAEYLIDKFGLKEREDHKSNQLSGGQIQRVAIARSLIMNPSLILADEPTGNLDSKKAAEIMKIFQEINDEDDATIILITHDENTAKYADKVWHIKDGQLFK